MEPQQHISLKEYGRAITKRWKIVVAFALLGLALGAYMYKTAVPAYTATSEVLVERPSGYSISGLGAGVLGSGLNAGASTSTKQQSHFLETNSYQQIARALTDIAPRVHLDLTDSATLDDIGTVIQKDILNSEYVTPVRIAMYDLPSSGLLSFQQAKIIKGTPSLRKNLDLLAKMSKVPGLTSGWLREWPGQSDDLVRDHIRTLAVSRTVSALQSLGVTDAAASDLTNTTDEPASANLGTYTKVALAANVIGILSDLDQVCDKDKKPFTDIAQAKTPEDVVAKAGYIMSCGFVKKLEFGPGELNWNPLPPSDKLAAIQKAGEAFDAWKAQHAQKEDTVWDVGGKEVGDGTDIIAITQTAPTAELARTAANAMAAVMVWQDRMTKMASDERGVRSLTAQIGDARSGAMHTLRMRENEVTAFQKANGMLDAATQLKSAAEEAASLDADKGKALVAMNDAQASLRKVLQQLGVSQDFIKAPTIKPNPLIVGISTELIKTETDLAGLRAQGFTDEWPAVMSAKAQLENLQRRLANEVHDSIERQYTPDPVHFALAGKAADLAATIVGLQARQTALGRLIGDMDNRFSTLPGKEADLARLMRAQYLAEQEYRYLNERLIDAKTNRVIRQGNARVVAVATDPGKKIAPKKRSIGIAALLGVFLGCLCAVALSAADSKLRTAGDVQRELKLPILAHLPAIPAGDGLIVESSPGSAVTEGFRALRSTVRFAGGDNPPKSIAATAVRSGDTKSAVVANLAASLAQAGLTITAVDADLRRPRLASFFGSNASSGLAETLSTGKPARDARQATRIPGLYVLPAGSVASGAAELLENGRFGAALNDLVAASDMVVIDTAPIGAVSDAAIVGSVADSTILVIEAGSVTPDEARDAVARLTSSARANLIGVVLVGGDAPVSSDYRQYAGGDADSVAARRGRKSQA